jgi:hypothetical protein
VYQTGLRRAVAVVADKSQRSNAAADTKLAENGTEVTAWATRILLKSLLCSTLTHEFNTWELGDEILVTTPDSWVEAYAHVVSCGVPSNVELR